MKKIYILTAVFALLTLSLNAQQRTTSHTPLNMMKSSTSGVIASVTPKDGGMHKAPMRVELGEGEYLFGPYDTDEFSTTGVGLSEIDYTTSTSEAMEVFVGIPRSEFQSHVGDMVQGFRFAVTQDIRVFDFTVYGEGPNHYLTSIFSTQFNSGNYSTYSGNQWLEFTFNTPFEFQVPDSITTIWMGYGYWQYNSTSGTGTPLGQNLNSTGHEELAYSNYYGSFYDATSYFSGDLAVQLIMKSNLPKTDAPTLLDMVDNGDGTYTITATATDPTATVTLTIGDQTVTGTGSASITLTQGENAQNVTATATAKEDGKRESDPATRDYTIPGLPRTATPTINVVTNADGSKTISATGDGTVHLYVDGVEVSNPYTIMPSADGDQTVTVTATAQEAGKLISETATQTVNIPEAGRSPKPTITMTDNGDGTYTITVTGTGEIAVYINDAEHGSDPIATANNTFSFNVEEHSQAMSITVQATNQEEGLLISRTAEETFSIPAMTIGSDFKELDPQPANASAPIDMSKLMFVDRFGVVIPNENNHPRVYDYTLEEAQVRQRSSNSVEVPVKHTGSDGLGYYTLEQIDNDTDAKLKMNVRNAAIELPLENDPGIYFYTAERSTAAYPDQADRKYFGVLQRTSDGNYAETLNPSYDWQQEYPGGQHHIHLDVDTVVGQYNDYLTYVPVVWTMGFDRVLYPTDHEHNSYGAPKWKTGVAQVEMDSHETPPVAERQINKDNSVNWTAEGGPASLYILDNVVATATMPTVNTMPYEPYMFRIFVKSNNGKLRKYKTVAADPTNTTQPGEHLEGVTTSEAESKGPWCVWSGYVDDPNNAQKGVEITEGENGKTITFKKKKVDREYTDNGNPLSNWDLNEENAMFGALDALATDGEMINADDLTIYVRFYYIVKGSAEGHEPWTFARTAPGMGDPAGYGAEAPGRAPGQATAVNEITYQGEVVETLYYNVQGMVSDKPFDGVNIVVTRFGNGTTSVSKIVR